MDVQACGCDDGEIVMCFVWGHLSGRVFWIYFGMCGKIVF